MKNNYRIVVVTAAGRRQYMKFLVPHILMCDVIDRYDIWVNTMNKYDIAFFNELAINYSKIRLVYQPEKVINGIASINSFYRQCVDSDTIYIKLDDDIIWMGENALLELINYRIGNPEYFLVSPIVINNGLCAYSLYNSGKLPLSRYLKAYMEYVAGWCSPKFAEKYHRWFFNKIIEGTYRDLFIDNKPIAMNRFSINAVAWFGASFAKFEGMVVGDDGEFLSVIKPTELGLSNSFVGNSFMVHYAFSQHKKYLDSTDILSLYDKHYKYVGLQYYKNILEMLDKIESKQGLDQYVERTGYRGVPKNWKKKLAGKKFYFPQKKRLYEFYVDKIRPLDIIEN